MKGRFNIPMTEYYVEGENTGEFMYLDQTYHPWLEKQGFRLKRTYTFPVKNSFAFMITYETPAQFQADAFIRNLTNYKI